MENEQTANSTPGSREPVRSKDGREDLPDDINEKLKDAVWAGLAQRMREDKAMLCRQKGHIWVDDPDGITICQRCGSQKKQVEELADRTEETS